MKKLVIIGIVVVALAGVAFYSGLFTREPAQAADQQAAQGQGGGGAAGPGGFGGGSGRGGRGGFGGPMTVELASASRGLISQELIVVGNLIGDTTVAVVPRAAGRLQDVYVKLGDRVARGQRIAKIEDQELQEQIRQAEAAQEVSRATIRQREADLKLAQTNVERSRSLFERQLLPKQTLDDNEARYQSAVAALDLARAQSTQSNARLEELRVNMTNTVVVSPVNGFVARRAADPGAFVSQNAPVVDVVDIGRVRLVVNVVEKDMKMVGVGDQTDVEVDAFPGEMFTGRVARVAPVLDPATRTFPIEIEIPNPGFRLKPGMYARVGITTQEKPDALTVPSNALVDVGGERGVFLTEQLVSRSTGELFFDMSRRRALAKGAFGGTANVSLRPEYLTNFYQQLDGAKEGMRFALIRTDGRVIARWPGKVEAGAKLPGDSYLMQSVAQGGTEGRSEGASPFDSVERLVAWRQLGPYHAFVSVGIDKEMVLSAWYRRVALLAAFTFPLAGGFALMAWVALRRAREELEAGRLLQDETERRKRIELSLIKSQKLEAMGRMTGGVAHDFNNLLMIISNNLHLFRRNSPDGVNNAHLAGIDRAVAAGAKLTRQMLSFSRQQALRPERILLKDKIPAILDLLRPVLGHSIRLRASVTDDAAAIEVDPAEFELALINLAVNAKDAMPEGGQLNITARNIRLGDRSGDFVVIEVSDTGFGMNGATLERAFEPFFTTKPVGYGTGLGLSQVQGLCQSAGGMARVASQEGVGTRVSLYFPAREYEVNAPTDGQEPNLKRIACRLLLVEDNESLAQGTTEVLQSMGCQVQTVGDAKAALSRLASHEFDLVITDIEMPGGVDGIALAVKLAKDRPELPVLLMTGYATRLEEATRQRFTVLPKPCSPSTFSAAIRNVLAGRQRNRRAAGSTP